MDYIYITYKVCHEDEMGRACSVNEEKRKVYMLLVGKPEGNRPLGKWTGLAQVTDK
jgi:hypothetical protein